MKKLLCVLVAAFMAMCVSAQIVSAAPLEDNNIYDDYFLQTLDHLLGREGYDEEVGVEASKYPLYDIELDQLGYVYEFEVEGEEGYAIMSVTIPEMPAIREFYFDATCPYSSVDGMRVYVQETVYWYWDGENYRDAATDVVIDEEAVASAREVAYRGGAIVDGQIDYVEYVTRTPVEYKLAYSYPDYYSRGYSDSCASVAGGNIVGYYDRWQENLIENFVPGSLIFNTLYVYESSSSYIDAMIDQLYADMGISGSGATVSMFRSGLQKYVNRQNYNVTFNSTMTAGVFDYLLAKTYLVSNVPVSIFMETFAVNTLFNNSDLQQEKIEYTVVPVNHVMVLFGYYEIAYTFGEGLPTRTDKYFHVATGNSSLKWTYLNADINQQAIGDALAVVIS